MDRDKSIIGQNAGTTAAAILNTLVNAGVVQVGSVDDALAVFDTIRTSVFNGSLALAGSEMVAETFATTSAGTVASSYAPPAAGGGNRPNADVEIKFGKHSGKTIGSLYDSGKEGVEYLEWAGSNINNDFLKKRINEFLAAA